MLEIRCSRQMLLLQQIRLGGWTLDTKPPHYPYACQKNVFTKLAAHFAHCFWTIWSFFTAVRWTNRAFCETPNSSCTYCFHLLKILGNSGDLAKGTLNFLSQADFKRKSCRLGDACRCMSCFPVFSRSSLAGTEESWQKRSPSPGYELWEKTHRS